MLQAEIIIEIGKRIQEIRLSKNMTQEAVADEIEGWDRQLVSRIETGVTNPTIGSYIKICLVLDIELADIFKDIKIK